jgi:hypothetical protein
LNENTKYKKQMTKKKITSSTSAPTPAKGRKPKGGKLISKTSIISTNDSPLGNIILHLKCSLDDLEKYNENYNKQMTDPMLYTPIIPPEIQTYDTTELHYNYIEENAEKIQSINKENFAYINTPHSSFICSFCNKPNEFGAGCGGGGGGTEGVGGVGGVGGACCESTKEPEENTVFKNSDENTASNSFYQEEPDISVVNQKLKALKIQLMKNKINDKKAACFWCSYDFDNPECYIPSYEIDNSICGYGSFCRPECAVAYLMKESIDDTTKFERYNLINQIYGKIYNYKKNVKPAPNPFYLLDKYYGNLTIEEYRKLLKSNHLLMIVEKPLTRIFPELHEDTDDFSVSNSNYKLSSGSIGAGSNTNETQYKVKKNGEKKATKTKTSIIQEHFGLS